MSDASFDLIELLSKLIKKENEKDVISTSSSTG